MYDRRSKSSPPSPYLFTSHFWSSRDSPALGCRSRLQQELTSCGAHLQLKKRPPAQAGGRAARAGGSRDLAKHSPLCSLSSGSAGDYSGAPSHTKINKQFLRSPGNFGTLNKSLQSQLWLHFTLTSSLTAPSFQDQLEACAKRIKTKTKHSKQQGENLKSKVKLSSPALSSLLFQGEHGNTGTDR